MTTGSIRHRPNSIPRKMRAILAACACLFALYATAELAIGYTYLPAKRGGVLLSGWPTVLIAMSALSMCLCCATTIVDHYDLRPNEDSYRAIRSASSRSALILFVAAPFAGLAITLLRAAGMDLPDFRGFAAGIRFYSESRHYHSAGLQVILANAFPGFLAGAALAGIGLLLNKYAPGRWRRAEAVLMGTGLLILSSLLLASAAEDFIVGEVRIGRYSHQTVVSALTDPAKFNAVMLTYFLVGTTLFLGGLFAIVFGLRMRMSRTSMAAPRPGRQASRSKHE